VVSAASSGARSADSRCHTTGGFPTLARATAAFSGPCSTWKPLDRCREPGGRIKPFVKPRFGVTSMLGALAANAFATSRAW